MLIKLTRMYMSNSEDIIALPQSNAPRLFEVKPIETLSPAELRVLKLAAAGKSEVESGAHLNISYKTIKFHKTNLFKKLKVKNIMQAVLMLERETNIVVTEVNAKEYIAEFSRLNNLLQYVKDELEVERSKASKAQLELELLKASATASNSELSNERNRSVKYKAQLDQFNMEAKNEFKFLPSSSVAAFADKLNGVPK